MRAGADRSSGELEFARSELRNTRIRLDELTTEVDKLSAQVQHHVKSVGVCCTCVYMYVCLCTIAVNDMACVCDQNLSLEARVRDLVAQLRRQQEEHEQVLSMKDAEIRALKTQIEEQLSEYRDLLSIKIQLDNEIATYNRLLESEETRCVSAASAMHRQQGLKYIRSVHLKSATSFV